MDGDNPDKVLRHLMLHCKSAYEKTGQRCFPHTANGVLLQSAHPARAVLGSLTDSHNGANAAGRNTRQMADADKPDIVTY